MRMLGNDHAGLRNWMLQRLTALILAIYSLALGALVLLQQPMQFGKWKALFDPAWMRIATLLFLVSLFIHAWLGVRDIFKDYVPNAGLRKVLLSSVMALLLTYSIWSIAILWRI